MTDLQFCDPDNWYGVHDAHRRKQIQNRLAQRARRKRQAKKSFNQQEPPRPPTTPSSCNGVTLPQTVSSKEHLAIVPPCLCTQQRTLPPPIPTPGPGRTIFPNVAYTTVVPPTRGPSATFPVEIPPSVFTALFNNGAMMGLTCGTTVPGKSTPQPPSIPGPLHPTAIQLTTIHPRWIDRFPFPRMRDNLITLTGIMDEDEFLKDMFSMESFSIKPGNPSWDPAGWVMEKRFSKKWGYLFY